MRESGLHQKLVEMVAQKAHNASRKLFLLDFDGTLVDFAADISGVNLPEDLLHLLQRLADLPDTYVVIITGRSKKSIENLIGNLNIDIVAEHGAVIRENGIWKTLVDDNTDWKKKIYPIIGKYTSNFPDSFMEDKLFSIAWHYRKLDKNTGILNSKALINELFKSFESLNLMIIDGKKVVEIMSNKVNKGLATVYLTNKTEFDFILSIGDDKTDEDMFKVLSDNIHAYTFKIGKGNSCAKFNLSNVKKVKILLKRLLVEME